MVTQGSRIEASASDRPLSPGGKSPLWALLAIQVAVALPFLIPSVLPESIRDSYSDSLADIALGLTTGIACALACLMRTDHLEERRFRFLLLSAALFWLVAELMMWLVPVEFSESLLGDALVDGAFVMALLCLIIAAEQQPHLPPGWTRKNGAFVIRILSGIFATAALYTYFTLAPNLSGLPDWDNWSRSMLLFIPLDLFLGLRFLWLQRAATCQRWRLVYLVLTCLAVTNLVADVAELLMFEEIIPWADLEPMGLLWFLPYNLLLFASIRIVSTSREPLGAMVPRDDFLTTAGVIFGLAAVILLIHLLAPGTGSLAPHLAHVRDQVALASVSALGFLGMIQAMLLARHNRYLTRDLEGANTQFLHAQKMEAIGQLAGEVAHDFNNLLAVLMGHEEALREALDPDDALQVHVKAIRSSCSRGENLTRHLLTFSRKHVRSVAVLDTRSVMERVHDVLSQLVGKDVEIRVRNLTPNPWIVADGAQLEQMIVNLALNARDAMPEGGVITVTTREEVLTQEDARAIGAEAGAHVIIEVADTGTGMTAAVMDRAFEPFFTTKAETEGTGLGLSAVYAIAQAAAGYITIDSQPGTGTTVRAIFRKSEEAPENSAPTPEPQAPRGSESVLLVEDDPGVRAVLSRGLQRRGYRVIEAEDGAEALRLAEAGDPQFDILITDVVMPGVSGPEVARRLTADRPDLPVLFISGYTDNELGEQGLSNRPKTFLQKPFTNSALTTRVRTLLDDRNRTMRAVCADVHAP